MSIMGMRDWFHNHRYVVIGIFGLLLLGLLGAYGQFGSSVGGGVTPEQYETAIAESLTAYEADEESSELAYAVASYYAQYSSFLDQNMVDKDDETYDDAKAFADETYKNAAKYYGIYYGLLADDYKAAYEAEKSYVNAAQVANALQQQANMQLELEDEEAHDTIAAEALTYSLLANDINLEEVKTALAEDATNSEKLAELAGVYTQRASYYAQQEDETAVKTAYTEALNNYQAAYDNAGEDVEVGTKAMYLVYQGSIMEQLEMEDAYGKYVAALEMAPNDYDVVMSMASYLVGAMEYEKAKDLIVELQANYEEDSEEYKNIDGSVEYLDSMIEMMSQIEDGSEEETTEE